MTQKSKLSAYRCSCLQANIRLKPCAICDLCAKQFSTLIGKLGRNFCTAACLGSCSNDPTAGQELRMYQLPQTCYEFMGASYARNVSLARAVSGHGR